MREVLRKRFDKIWVVDLGGDSRSKPPSENVFLGVQTPNAMIIAIRLPATADRESSPAEVRYTKLSGAREEKLVRLLDLRSLTADDTWEECESSWGGRFSPKRSGLSRNWVNLEKIFPWSARGLQFSRTWPIGENKEVLKGTMGKTRDLSSGGPWRLNVRSIKYKSESRNQIAIPK